MEISAEQYERIKHCLPRQRGNVELEKSELVLAEGKEVTQFTINVTYTRPDTATIHRVPLRVSVR